MTNIKIPIMKPWIDDEEIKAVKKVLHSGWVTQGPRVSEFERSFAQYCSAKFAIATNSCTTALEMALDLIGLKPGDEVIVPSLSFIATANCVVRRGGVPIFADVEYKTRNIDSRSIEKCVSKRTRAIIAVDQVGLPADHDAIKALAKEYGLHVIEDAAAGLGSEYKHELIGGIQELTAFSFHPRKVITTGEGGMLTTNRRIHDRTARLLRQHGMSISDVARHKAKHVLIEKYLLCGTNFRMTDIQAAIGIVQLQKLPHIIKQRNLLAKHYNEALQTLSIIEIPHIPSYVTCYNYQAYMVTFRKKGLQRKIMQRLLEYGIATRRGVMTSHREPAFVKKIGRLKLPVSEYVSDNSIILPLYHQMTEEEQSYVIDTIKKISRYV